MGALGLSLCLALGAGGARMLEAAARADGPATTQTAPAPDTQRDLGPTLAQICERHDVPAMGAAAIKQGSLWGMGTAGVRQHGKPASIEPGDLWYAGSCGRPATAILAAVLVEKGAIAWNSTVADVLPEVAEAAREEYRGATLEQLLRGTSGLPDDPGADSPIWKLVRGASGSPTEQRIVVAKIALRQEPAPGRRTHDSALSYVVAGAMLEAAGKGVFEDLMRDHVFTPLAMRSAGFGAPEARDQPVGHEGARFAGGPRAVAPNDPSYDPPVMNPAGAMHASLEDWLAFADFNLRGARAESGLLISPASFKVIDTDMARRDRAPMGWKLGGSSWAGGAALVRESEGAWYATIWVCPNANIAYVVTTNRGDKEGGQAAFEALSAMINAQQGEGE